MQQLAADPDQHWSMHAACAEHGSNPDMWFSGMTGAIQWHMVAEARHICVRHCPVRDLCKREIGPLRGAVVAGVFYNEKGVRSDHQPTVVACVRCTRG